jgi:hypothetical protein
MPHSFKIENNVLLERLKSYKNVMGYKDKEPYGQLPLQ